MAVGPCKSHDACYYVRHVRHVGAVTEGRIGESTTGTYVCFLKSRVCTLWMHKRVAAEAWVRVLGYRITFMKSREVWHYGARKSLGE